jgi:hypothetical protein
MSTRQNKPEAWKLPSRTPPSESSLRDRGRIKRTIARSLTESADEAYRRATKLPWGGTIVDEQPYWSGRHWIFICKEAA